MMDGFFDNRENEGHWCIQYEKHLASLLDQLLSQLSIKSRPTHICHSIGCSSFLVAYSPVGKQKFVNDQDIQAISRRLNITTAQVILSYPEFGCSAMYSHGTEI